MDDFSWKNFFIIILSHQRRGNDFNIVYHTSESVSFSVVLYEQWEHVEVSVVLRRVAL